MGEIDVPELNQTLAAAKQQCLMDVRKSRKSVNASDDTIEGDGGLYSMFSCDRMNRWKTVVTCTVDCVAQKVGMVITVCLTFGTLFQLFCPQFDAKGVINVEVAKRVVIENFAKQPWEQDASNKLVEKCAKEVTDSTSKAMDSFGFQCNSKAAEFAYCMWRELFLTCPDDKQENSRQCQKLRVVLVKHNENKFKV